MIFVNESCNVKYVGESCTGCLTFKKYTPFIERLSEDEGTICASCEAILPSHIPKGQQKRYLDRIFRKELNEIRKMALVDGVL